MIFEPTALPGVFVIVPRPHSDERGFFARTWDADLFAQHGLPDRFVQSNVSYNRRAGTMRGMHWQAAPAEEGKLVRATAGAVWDVCVDLRPGSPTRLQHVGVRLDAELRNALYIPEGFAHGFLTLADDTEVFYEMSEVYVPETARGLRWDDPVLGIEWPAPVTVISERDATYPDLEAAGDLGVTPATPSGVSR
jgi:dTDP-4-dehydrorhamnose 3,5-epimerase